jgi:hypothetical protein
LFALVLHGGSNHDKAHDLFHHRANGDLAEDIVQLCSPMLSVSDSRIRGMPRFREISWQQMSNPLYVGCVSLVWISSVTIDCVSHPFTLLESSWSRRMSSGARDWIQLKRPWHTWNSVRNLTFM